MQVSAGSVASFTGVLVQRDYKPGQKYIQLVYHTAEGVRLSFSRNIDAVRSLTVGRTYQVKGREYNMGGKTFIHETSTKPVQDKPVFFKRRAFVLAIGIMLVSGVGVASAQFLTTSDSSSATPVTTQTTTKQRPTAEESKVLGSSVSAPTTETKPAPSTTPNPATTSSVKTVKTSSKSTRQTNTRAGTPTTQTATQTSQSSSDAALEDTTPPKTDGAQPVTDPSASQTPDTTGSSATDTSSTL
jgi:hypothetical protein